MYNNGMILIFLSIALNGCTSSGVIPLGPDTYTISTSNELSPAYAKKSAMNEALAHCTKNGKQLMPMQSNSGSHRDSLGDSIATFDYTFRCLAQGDKDLGRTQIKNKSIDININKQIKGNVITSSNSDLYSELTKLNQLKTDGLITEAEYNGQKKKVLSRF